MSKFAIIPLSLMVAYSIHTRDFLMVGLWGFLVLGNVIFHWIPKHKGRRG